MNKEQVVAILLDSHPELQVTKIAFEVGFNDICYFQRTFKRLVGVSPNRFRNR